MYGIKCVYFNKEDTGLNTFNYTQWYKTNRGQEAWFKPNGHETYYNSVNDAYAALNRSGFRLTTPKYEFLIEEKA